MDGKYTLKRLKISQRIKVTQMKSPIDTLTHPQNRQIISNLPTLTTGWEIEQQELPCMVVWVWMG